MNTFLILPAYNEAENLKTLLPCLIALREGQELSLFAILINDGSQDDTAEIAETVARYYPWFKVIHHKQNQGLGGALATGFKEALARAQKDDVIITIDADNTMDPFTIPMLTRAIKGGADLAVASRYVPGAEVKGVPFIRRVISRGGSFLCRAIIQAPGLRDYTSGYRAYRAAILETAAKQWKDDFITSRAFDCQMEILLKVLPYVQKIREIPINLDYSCKVGKSHLNVWRTAKGYFSQFRWFLKQPKTQQGTSSATATSGAMKEG